MGWWKTEHGVLGDDHADVVAEGLARLDSSTPVELVRALVHTLALEAGTLFEDPLEAVRWRVELERGGVSVELGSAAPEPDTLEVVRETALNVAVRYREGHGRAPTPPELVDAFAFVLRPRFDLELRSVVSEAILRDPDLMVRRRFAADPRTPEPFVDALADDPSEIVRTAAYRRRLHQHDLAEAAASTTDGARLVELASSDDEVIALAVLRRDDKDATVSAALARSKHVAVRYGLARHPGTPAAVLEVLVRDRDEPTRLAALRHPAIPQGVLRAISKRFGIDTHQAICANPAAPPDVLVELANSPFSEVRDAALLHRRHPLDSLQRHAARDVSMRCLVARSLATPLDMLLAFAREPERRVRIALAERSELPERLAEVLGGDRDADIRIAVARNPRCPSFVLEVLALDTNREVRAAASRREA